MLVGVCVIVALLASANVAMAGKDLFQGKWKVTVTPDEDSRKAGEKEFADTLVFDGNKFTATECEKEGFKAVEYEIDQRAHGPAKFTATATSEKQGKAAWGGTAVVKEITGTLVWTKKDGSVMNYTFKGSKE
jgi:hypothetical protein